MLKRSPLKRYTRINPRRPKRAEMTVGKVTGRIRLYGAAKSRLREDAYWRDKGRCQWEGCRKWAPLYGDLFERAHMAHIVSLGAGGSDTLDNVRILCPSHHLISEHTKGLKG